MPPREDDAAARAAWEADLASVREETAKQERELLAARDGERTHAEVQGWIAGDLCNARTCPVNDAVM